MDDFLSKHTSFISKKTAPCKTNKYDLCFVMQQHPVALMMVENVKKTGPT